MIYKYNDFLLENKYNDIINELFIVLEKGKWINDHTYEWDLNNNKLKNFLSKLTKEKVRNYFYKFMEKIKNLPNSKKIITRYATIFLTFVSLNYLTAEMLESEKEKFIDLINQVDISIKSSFEEAQKFVKLSEGGYTDNKKDPGNYINTPYGKRLIGTNHGISAPVLTDWMGKLPTKEDMINLDYKTALNIYKNKYWDSKNLSEYTDQLVATIIYDSGVNQGPNATKTIIKKACDKQGLSVKNPYNKKDIKNINKLDQELLFNNIKELRKQRYHNTKERGEFLDGWLNRLNSLNYQ